jgi:hypothetical protein
MAHGRGRDHLCWWPLIYHLTHHHEFIVSGAAGLKSGQFNQKKTTFL